jgi:hypothetical protein
MCSSSHACSVAVAFTPLLLTVLQALVQQKQPLTAAALEAAIDNIRGAVMICYPAGLPAWDFVRQCLEGREDLTGTNVSHSRAAM